MSQEDAYIKSLKEAGVDLPEIEEKEEAPKVEEPVVEKPEVKTPPEKEEEDTPDDEGEEDKAPKPAPKKRSIYDDLKDKKKEVRDEKTLRENAERERDELKTKLEAITNAKNPEARQEAIDDFEELAKEIDADPQTIEKMFTLFKKKIGVEALPTDVKESLEEFRNWKKENSVSTEAKQFEADLTSFEPKLKESFPGASEAELSKIKSELKTIAHSEGWNDKSLDYILFEHQTYFSKNFVSPRKDGMESVNKKGSDDKAEVLDTDFNPSADLSLMTLKQRADWEAKYKTLTASPNSLSRDSQNRRIII